MKIYSAPYMSSVTPDGSEDVILTSSKPVVVFSSVVLAEGRDDGSCCCPLGRLSGRLISNSTRPIKRRWKATLKTARLQIRR